MRSTKRMFTQATTIPCDVWRVDEPVVIRIRRAAVYDVTVRGQVWRAVQSGATNRAAWKRSDANHEDAGTTYF